MANIRLEDLLDENGQPTRFGSACSALKKTWWVYKLNKKKGETVSDLEWRINEIQSAMGISTTDFDQDDDDFGEWEGL